MSYLVFFNFRVSWYTLCRLCRSCTQSKLDFRRHTVSLPIPASVGWYTQRFRHWSLGGREYWMNYRGPGFLAAVCFGSSPTTFNNWYLFVSFPVRRRSGYWRERGGRGWARNQIIWPRESLALCKSFNTLWLGIHFRSTSCKLFL
jgi:hypothetical protein